MILPLLLTLGGCIQPKGVDTSVQPVLSTPQIVSLSVSCDADKGKWTVEAEASSWTGGATTIWTADSEYIEIHYVSSVSIAEDGSRDSLAVTLNISEDFRDTKPGSSTAFLCGQNPSLNFWLLNTEGDRVDCRSWGDVAVLEAAPNLALCDTPNR